MNIKLIRTSSHEASVEEARRQERPRGRHDHREKSIMIRVSSHLRDSKFKIQNAPSSALSPTPRLVAG